MPAIKEIFLKDSQIAFDRRHRRTIGFNMSKYNQAVQKGKQRYKNMELAKQRASYIKAKTMVNLADYLVEFEKNAVKKQYRSGLGPHREGSGK